MTRIDFSTGATMAAGVREAMAKAHAATITPQNVADAATHDLACMNSDTCWIYWKIEKKVAPWHRTLDTEENRQQAITAGAMYFTMPALSKPYDEIDPEEPHRWADFSFDFDDAEHPENALEDVKKLFFNGLAAHLDLDPSQCQFWLSGSKGLHASIPAICFGADGGHPYLPLIYKKIAARWAVHFGLKSLDLRIYNMRSGRMFRIPNVRRSNGRYKVPVTVYELNLPVAELLALANAPREIEEDCFPPQPIPAMCEVFDAAREEVEAEVVAQAQAEPMPEQLRENLSKNVPLCVQFILDKLPPKTETCNFNGLVLQLAAYFRDAGYDDAAATAAVTGFVENYPHSPTYPTPQKRLEHWRSIWAYLTAGQNDARHYPFQCSFMLGFHFPGSGFECKQCPCNPERKPTRAEWEEQIAASQDVDELLGLNKEIAASGLEQAELHRLQKIIAKRCGCTIKDLRVDAKKAAGPSEDDRCHLDFARDMIQQIGSANALTTSQGIWRWQDRGVWQLVDDRAVRAVAHRVIPAVEIAKGCIDSVLDLFKTETFRPDHVFDRDPESINALNGELHWTGSEWELRPHNRASYRTTQVTVPYDPAAQAPRFIQFLGEVFEGEADRTERCELVCELLGYTLLSTCRFEKFVVLFGSGANGKSVLLQVVERLVGVENVAAVQPSQFENRFQRAHLHGKLANVVTEIAEGAEIADAQLKSIVSGELTTAEHKHKPPFDFRPFSTCCFGTNHLPHTRDFSDALFRRAFLLTFPRTFTTEQQDPQLKDKLLAELPGILNLALKGIAGVLQSGRFTEPPSCERIKREWRTECDQVAQFVEECCIIERERESTSRRLYDAYTGWAAEAGIKKLLNRKNFSGRLVRFGVKPHRTMTARIYVGIGLLDDGFPGRTAEGWS